MSGILPFSSSIYEKSENYKNNLILIIAKTHKTVLLFNVYRKSKKKKTKMLAVRAGTGFKTKTEERETERDYIMYT